LIYLSCKCYGNYSSKIVCFAYSGPAFSVWECHHSTKARRLDHNRSNLSVAIGVRHILSHEEVVKKAVNGELGNTEVKANQVW
jgi:hypothetical protein